MRSKNILTIAILILLFTGCKEATKVEDSASESNRNTLNDSDLGHETGRIEDYFFDFDEKIVIMKNIGGFLNL